MDIKLKSIYQHFKGNYYEVIDIARSSETLEEFVVYRALYGDFGLWIRPLKMFLETVEREGKTVPRFKFIIKENAEKFLENQNSEKF
ncbi:MAG: DUF1653 domain-containing protein [Chlamydiia bacterium]